MTLLMLRDWALTATLWATLAATATAQTSTATASPTTSADAYPAWAYLWDPNFVAPAADDALNRIPGSNAAFSWKQARDLFFVPDWHPQDHAPMPTVVAQGRKPDVRACSSCHRAEGTGGPENSSLAGLPAAYLVQQLLDYKSGARKFSGPQRSSVLLMTAAAKAMTDDEIQAAANYFSTLKPKQNIKVIESDTVPKTYVARLFYVKQPQGGTEPLGNRIVEMPDDVHQFELRDSRSQFTAYVPPGSVARGEALVKSGGGGVTVACATCHGADLKGAGPIPGIAGRFASYTMRQLFDFKNGARAGALGSALMKPNVEKMSEGDMMAVAAYLATLPP